MKEVAVVNSASPGCLPVWSYANMPGTAEEIRKVYQEEWNEHVFNIEFVSEEEAQELVFGG